MEYFIKQNSQEPLLSLTLYQDEKYFQEPFSDRVENAIITFSMKNEKGVYKVLNKPCKLLKEGYDYVVVYMWDKKDTEKEGVYNGEFTISFLDEEYQVSSKVVLPIKEKLSINII